MNVEGVGSGELGDGDADRIAAVVIEVGAIVFGAEFGVTYISEPNESSVGIAFEDDVIELIGFRETPDDADAHLEVLPGHCGLRAHAAGGHFDVLFREGVDDIVRSKRAASETNRVEPKAHGILALSKDQDIGDAGDAFETVADVNIEIIAHKERGIAAVGREDGAAKNEVLRSLGDGNADLLDGGGETSRSSVDTVLDVNRGEIGIASDIERRGNRADPGVGAGRSDVLHALGAVDLLLQRRGHSRLDGLRTG